LIDVRVSRRGAGRLESGHVWIYQSDVLNDGGAKPGSAVRVLEPKGRVLGIAHFSSASEIRLRFLGREGTSPDAAFFEERIARAQAYRVQVVQDSDSYRLVHAEGDQLPALVIDRYGDYFSVQLLNQGMDAARSPILCALEKQFRPRGVLLRNDAPVRSLEKLPLEKTVAAGEVPDCVELRMNGFTWFADLMGGQKTGVYLDQRENYIAAARYAGGAALDCFTSTGGFALHLARRCERVEGVDSSAAALETARRNAAANDINNVDWQEADVFSLLKHYAAQKRKYSIIVLDPPALARNRSSVEAALRAYKEINLRALKMLETGGVLVTCSCSFHVGEADLLQVIAEAALDAGKTLRVLERRSQSQDHPILLTVPETHYLKCIILQVM
jgi:23S rRNA (cytosine1962-C5)-methyltransferase